VLVAFSGGADSTALALILQELGHDLVLAHVDHQMREASAEDAEHCARVAESLGLPFFRETASVDPPTEAEAREARYNALQRMAARGGAGLIATGHTMDDNAETVLLRLSRGGEPIGIPPRRGNIVRPLLDLRRAEAREVCRSRGIQWIEDPSNRDERLARNRIRRRVLPGLGDAGVRRLALIAEEARSLKEAVDADVTEAISSGAILVEEDRSLIDLKILGVSPEPARFGIVRRALERFDEDPSSRLVDAVLQSAEAGRGVVDVTGGVTAAVGSVYVEVGPRRQILPRPPDLTLPVPGRVVSAEWGMEFRADIVPPPPSFETQDRVAFVDLDTIDSEVVIRPRLPGDRFRPLGLGGTKKLQDYLVDVKVPERDRDRVPIFTSEGMIVWVGGHRIDERARVRHDSRGVARLEIFPLLP
jgi:tRNA(Ile)-lysidine synthase